MLALSYVSLVYAKFDPIMAFIMSQALANFGVVAFNYSLIDISKPKKISVAGKHWLDIFVQSLVGTFSVTLETTSVLLISEEAKQVVVLYSMRVVGLLHHANAFFNLQFSKDSVRDGSTIALCVATNITFTYIIVATLLILLFSLEFQPEALQGMDDIYITALPYAVCCQLCILQNYTVDCLRLFYCL